MAARVAKLASSQWVHLSYKVRCIPTVCTKHALPACREFSSDSTSSTEKNGKQKEKSNEKSKKLDDTLGNEAAKKAPPTSKSAMSSDLIQQILSMKVTGMKDPDSGAPIELARPSGKFQKSAKMQAVNERPKEIIDSTVVAAVKDVATMYGGNAQETESELLQKLRQHMTDTKEKKAGVKIEDMLSGIKIDKSLARKREQSIPRRENAADVFMENGFRENLRPMEGFSRVAKSSEFSGPASRGWTPVDLFGAPPLNVFKQIPATSQASPLDEAKLQTWDKLAEREMRLLVTHPPKNAFEEMILWTEQGKLWRFPINNEQGREEEAKVGFHEHVFLEKWIADFPKKGPIRHFMELVLVGLSKNPYLTVEEKTAHIDWFRKYFKAKEDILKEVGALEQ